MNVLDRFGGLVAVFGLVAFAPPLASQETGGFREISYQTGDGGVIFGNLYGEGPHAVLLGHGAVFDKESWGFRWPGAWRRTVIGLWLSIFGAMENRKAAEAAGVGSTMTSSAEFAISASRVRRGCLWSGRAWGAVLSAMRSRSSTRAKSTASSCWPPSRPALRNGCRAESYSSFPRATDQDLRWRRQFQAASEPKQLAVLPGNAHAQHIFGTPRGEELTEIILDWIAAEP